MRSSSPASISLHLDSEVLRNPFHAILPTLATIKKMKTNTIIIIIGLLLFDSCFQDKTYDKERIKEFEIKLGKQETKFLNEIVADMNIYLDKNYKQVLKKNRFKAYLTAIVSKPSYNLFLIDSLKLNKYKTSNLFTKYILEYPDSVWEDKGSLYVHYNYYNENLPVLSTNKSAEEQIDDLKRESIRKYISISPFYNSLDTINAKDSLISIFLECRDLLGHGRISPAILADIILKYSNDSSDYFGKRIFIMGLYDY